MKYRRGGSIAKTNKTVFGIVALIFGIIFMITTYSIFSVSSSINDDSYYEDQIKDVFGEDVVIIGGQSSFEQDKEATQVFSIIVIAFMTIGAGICILGIVFIIKGLTDKKRNNNDVAFQNDNFGNVNYSQQSGYEQSNAYGQSSSYYQQNTYNLNGEIYKRDKNSLDL